MDYNNDSVSYMLLADPIVEMKFFENGEMANPDRRLQLRDLSMPHGCDSSYGAYPRVSRRPVCSQFFAGSGDKLSLLLGRR